MGQEERDNVVPFAPKDEAEPIENIELVDTHTHLNDDKFADDVPDAVARARAAGVRRCINMGDTLASSKKAVELALTKGSLPVSASTRKKRASSRRMTTRSSPRGRRTKKSSASAKSASIITG